ncbi:NBS-containing resistance-like protein [Trifolium medium]|uniref:NBS-containing resistance-like protein n=1 Tax=Trifolium medium TaxID=97028 RepID=A0A392NCV2_9FABA|nr:NBS-containing resistance-like protein [Trifolium medium]
MASFTSSSSSSSSKRKSDDVLMEEETSQLEDDKFISWLSSAYPSHNYWNETEHNIENVQRDLFDGSYTQSLNSRVQDVIQLLKQSKSPFLLGIWGMPGIGKTTIANAIYA